MSRGLDRQYLQRISLPASPENFVLLSILILAFLLRIWGIWNVSTTDEYNEVIEALRVCSGHFNYERWFKRFYLYILAFEYGVYYTIGWIFNVFASPMDFAEKIVRQMEPLFILGRVTSAVAGACTVGVLYKIGVRFYNRRVAVTAALLMTFTVFHIDLSQQAKVDALLGLLVVTTFYFIFKLQDVKTSSKWDYVWCGFFMALAIQTKINTVVLLVPFAITIFWNTNDIKARISCSFRFSAPAFIFGFILGNPPVLLAPLKFYEHVSGLGAVYTKAINVVPNDLIGFLAYPLYFFRSMGAVVSILTILAILYAFFNLNRQRATLAAFIVCFYILMGSSKYMVADYYMIPAVLFIYLLIGDFINETMEKLGSSGNILLNRKAMVLGFILFVALIRPGYRVAQHEMSLSGKNTRYIAKNWIEKNIPVGSKILMDSGKSINSSAPAIAENEKALQRILKTSRKNVREGKIVHGMVDKNALIYYELLLKTAPEKSYDITSTMFGLDLKSIGYYIENQYQYFIISKGRKEARTGAEFSRRYPQVAKFYMALDTDNRIKLIKTIKSTPKNKGDAFLIYELSENISKIVATNPLTQYI